MGCVGNGNGGSIEGGRDVGDGSVGINQLDGFFFFGSMMRSVGLRGSGFG